MVKCGFPSALQNKVLAELFANFANFGQFISSTFLFLAILRRCSVKEKSTKSITMIEFLSQPPPHTHDFFYLNCKVGPCASNVVSPD